MADLAHEYLGTWWVKVRSNVRKVGAKQITNTTFVPVTVEISAFDSQKNPIIPALGSVAWSRCVRLYLGG